jgi:hypothetical protein
VTRWRRSTISKSVDSDDRRHNRLLICAHEVLGDQVPSHANAVPSFGLTRTEIIPTCPADPHRPAEAAAQPPTEGKGGLKM